MTLPFERTRALLQTKLLLESMTAPKETPRVPKLLRGQAKLLLRHYPRPSEIARMSEAVPGEFGPVPSFFMQPGTTEAPRDKLNGPYLRTRALVQTKRFLEAMLDPKETPRVPRWMRGKAKSLLRHYPGLWEIDRVHKELPEVFGPVPPFSRLSGTADVQGVIDAAKDAE
jgi:hypothetical protein